MKKYNVLLLTVDDLNYNTLGCFGSPVQNVSPNIDSLCSEGVRFENSFVTIAVCQPSRSVLLTGRYPHKNGARGFEAIDASCTTLTEQLRKNGYINGIIGKEDHLAPQWKFCWDYYERTMNEEHDFGRNPESYYNLTKVFLAKSKREERPFFLMANSHDPHRPFAGSDQELKMFSRHIPCDHTFGVDDVEVLGCLPNLPGIRKETAQYYSSVKRADQTIGRILDALKESGDYDNTLILFLSDNGMAVPFCKTNCYLNSTKSPFVLKLPKEMEQGQVKIMESLVSGIDVTPTLLDILGIEQIEGVDGKSFKKSLYTNEEINDDIYTMFFKTSVNPKTKEPGYFPMRSVTTKKFVYVYNGWSDGEKEFKNESMSGLTFDAMVRAGKEDESIQKRVDMCVFRVKEELYDVEKDPDSLLNLTNDINYSKILKELRERMLGYMEQTQDGYLDKFKKEIISKITDTIA